MPLSAEGCYSSTCHCSLHFSAWPGFPAAERGEGWVCTGADSVVWQQQLGKLLPALAPPIPCCLHCALCARAPCRAPQVALGLRGRCSFFSTPSTSPSMLRPGPLNSIPYVRKRGLDPAASCTAPWPAMTHTPAPQSPGLWLHLPLAPSQLLSMCWVLSSEEQHCHANPSALFCFPLAHPALCMAKGLPAILFLFTKHVPT